MDTEIEALQRSLNSKIERVKDAEKLASRLQKENRFLEIEKGAAIMTLRQIQGMCGAPDPAEGCRNILAVCKQFSDTMVKL